MSHNRLLVYTEPLAVGVVDKDEEFYWEADAEETPTYHCGGGSACVLWEQVCICSDGCV